MPVETRSTKTKQTAVRITELAFEQAQELGRIWGPMKPLSIADVFVECVRRVHAQESFRKKSSRNSREEG